MYAKLAVVVSTLVSLAAAGGAKNGSNQCNTGNAQCCNSVYQAQSAQAKKIVGNIVGLDVGSLTGLVGAQCSPLSIVNLGVTGNCNSNAVCCSSNTYRGLANVDCVPIQL